MGKRFAIVIGVAAAGVMALGTQGAAAATIEVTDTSDSGKGSLRAAIKLANALPGFDRIVIGATGAIRAKTPLPDLETNLAIQGPGADKVSVHGGCATFECVQNNFPLPPTFAIAAGAAVTLRDISITDRAFCPLFSCEQDGVGNAGTLSLEHTRVYNTGGGGIVSSGTLTVWRSGVDGNVRGVANLGGSATIRQSAITGQYGAVAVYNRVGKLVVSQSTIANNGAEAINNVLGTATVRLTTVSNNGPIRNYSGNLALVQSTVVGDGYSIWNDNLEAPAGTVTVQSTILDSGPCQGGGPVTSKGYNLSETGTCNLTATGDQPNTEPLLKPLGFYGGPTMTHALRPTSPAVDAGVAGNAATDQRGLPRIINYPGVPKAVGGDNSDIGAFELQSP